MLTPRIRIGFVVAMLLRFAFPALIFVDDVFARVEDLRSEQAGAPYQVSLSASTASRPAAARPAGQARLASSTNAVDRQVDY